MTWQSHASIRKGRWKVTYGHVLDMARLRTWHGHIRPSEGGDRVTECDNEAACSSRLHIAVGWGCSAVPSSAQSVK